MCVKKSEFEELESSDCLCLALIMSAGMTVTPVLAEEATPEAAAPAETVAVDAPTFTPTAMM